MRPLHLLLAATAAASLVSLAAADAATSSSGSGFAAAFDPNTGKWIGGSSGGFAQGPSSSGRGLLDASTATSSPNARSAAYDPKTGKWIYSGSRRSLADASVSTLGENARAWSSDGTQTIAAGGKGDCVDAATLGNAGAFVVITWTTQVPRYPVTICRGATVRFVWSGEDAEVTQVKSGACPADGEPSVEIAPFTRVGNVGVSFNQTGTYYFVSGCPGPELVQRVDVVG